MLLVVDIGNSNATFGLYDGQWKDTWRIDSNDQSHVQLNELLNNDLLRIPIDAIVISSVVPQITDKIQEQLESKLKVKPYLITPQSYLNLPLLVPHPDKIGSDLVCDAMAAYHLFKADCMVIDFGTALTFTVVSENKILGVNIAPGLKLAMKSLADNTAQLSEIPLELPTSVIGKDTTTAIQSGILWGYVGLVERMIDRVNEELGTKLKVVATGGLSKVLEPLHQSFDAVDANLTLDGMRLIYEINHAQL